MPDRRSLENPPRAFISYARSDGEEFARGMRIRLQREEPEITLWQDRTDMEPAGWWRQITEALDRVPFLILVLTPAAVRSAMVWKEWHYARQQGVCIVLVKGAPGLDPGMLPRWMRRVQCYDLDHEWQTFVRALKGSPPATRVPFMAPDLPTGFVERHREFDQLRTQLLDADRHDPVAITTALRGAGGLGKTALATALCHDEEIQAAFDDGILWVTLGQAPNLLDGLTKLYAGLTGDRPPFRDIEDAANQLATKLEDRTCLIVLDDVWDPAHMRPFRRGGKECAWLITTRKLDVAADAKRVDVDTMSAGESVAMLTKQLDPPPVAFEPFRGLAHRLGQWPLLLELAGAALHLRCVRGDTTDGALVYVHRALDKKGVRAFDRANPAERHQSIALTIEVSTELLRREDRRRFLELAIFPEDIDTPLSALGALWGLDDFETEECVQGLADLSLVRHDLQARTIRIHDVIRTFLSEQLAELGIDPAVLHARLVEAWGDPHHLSDVYAWRSLAHHLTQARREARLRELLLDPTWMRAKLTATSVTSLLADYDALPVDDDCRLVQGAIRLSGNSLARDTAHLTSQLHGRLLSVPSPGIQQLLQRAGRTHSGAWLRPLTAALTPPGDLLRTLEGHRYDVRGVAVTPDQHRIVSGGHDGTLKVWDLRSGEQLRTLEGPPRAPNRPAGVDAVAVTPDGRRAISASMDNTLRVWDLDTGATLQVLAGHTFWVQAVAPTPDARRAVSAARDRTLRLWDLESGRTLKILKGHSADVFGVAVTPDGGRAVSASIDKTLRIWDLATGTTLRVLTGHTAGVNAVAVTPDGRRAVSASYDQTLRVWDLDTGTVLRTLTGHTGGVNTVALTAAGHRAVSAGDDQTIRLWDLESGTTLKTLRGHAGVIAAVALTRDGRCAVSAANDRTVKIWDLSHEAGPRVVGGHTSAVTAGTLTPDGRLTVTGSKDWTLKVWETRCGAFLRTLRGHAGRITAVATTPDGRCAVSASHDDTLKVWDLETGALLRTLTGHRGGVDAVVVTPDGRCISSSSDETFRIWDLETGATLRTRPRRARWQRWIALTPDGTRAMTLLEGQGFETWHLDSDDATLNCIVDRVSRTLIYQMPRVVATPDGRRAVSVSPDNGLQVWDLDTGKPLRAMVGHTERINSIAVTPDGSRVVSASADGTVRVWNLESGEPLSTFAGHAGPVSAVTLTGDGRRAISTSSDKSLMVWDLVRGELLACFFGEGWLEICGMTPDGRVVVAGDSGGTVHFLHLEEAESSGPS